MICMYCSLCEDHAMVDLEETQVMTRILGEVIELFEEE